MTKLCEAGSTRAAVLARSARTLSSAKQEARGREGTEGRINDYPFSKVKYSTSRV